MNAPLELRLGQLLGYGTGAACAVIAAGLIAPVFGDGRLGQQLVLAGTGLFIALPIARVATMLVLFLRAGDTRFGAISALVLAIVLLGIAIGILLPA
jgi:uncharacterized membrane protein